MQPHFTWGPSSIRVWFLPSTWKAKVGREVAQGVGEASTKQLACLALPVFTSRPVPTGGVLDWLCHHDTVSPR